MARMPKDDYFATMWNFYLPLFDSPGRARRAIRRFREMGCNAGTLTANLIDFETHLEALKVFHLTHPYKGGMTRRAWPYRQEGFPFYVMNVLRPVYWNWNDAKPVLRKQYEAFNETRDRSVFTRVPCVNDPRIIAEMDRCTRRYMEVLREEDTLDLVVYYDLRDEASIGSFALATDLCFCEHCMTRLRAWLKEIYGDLGGLNRAWDSQFASWDKVVPLTSQEALERRDAGHWNFAPWADHRTFMNDTFLRALVHAADVIREYDPEAVVGVSGMSQPTVFGGHDLAKLFSVLDWFEPYDSGRSYDILRSQRKHRRVPLSMGSFWDNNAAFQSTRLWRTLYQGGGCAGVVLWQSNAFFDVQTPDVRPLPGAKEMGEVLFELRSGAPRLLQQSEEVSSPVAIHYSHASINADFLLSCPSRWRSIAAWEDDNGALYGSREAWFLILEDLGLRPVFLSSEQIEAGDLERHGIRLLVLTRSVAVSDREAAAIKRFVKNGGVLAADSFPARMDEHCRDRTTGALDGLFGIKRLERDRYFCTEELINWTRPWQGDKFAKRKRFHGGEVENRIQPLKNTLVMGQTEVADSPVGIVSATGDGQTVLFNATPLNYPLLRTKGQGALMREFFGCCVVMAGITPEAVVCAPGSGAPLPGVAIFPFRHGPNRYFGLAVDLNISQDVLGAVQTDPDAKRGRVIVRFPCSGHIYDARHGTYLGQGSEAAIDLGVYSAPLLAVTKTRAKAMHLRFDGTRVKARLEVTGGKRVDVGERVFRFDLFHSRGKRVLDAGANVVAAGGVAAWTPEAPLPKGGRFVCRDVATGTTGVLRIEQGTCVKNRGAAQ